MKWLSYIFTFVVVLLTVQPTLVLASENHVSECCGSSCCEEENEDSPKDNQKKSNNCKDQNCNPFQSCGCCLGFTVKSEFYGVQSPIVQKAILVSRIENFISQYTPDFWQPPKIA